MSNINPLYSDSYVTGIIWDAIRNKESFIESCRRKSIPKNPNIGRSNSSAKYNFPVKDQNKYRRLDVDIEGGIYYLSFYTNSYFDVDEFTKVAYKAYRKKGNSLGDSIYGIGFELNLHKSECPSNIKKLDIMFEYNPRDYLQKLFNAEEDYVVHVKFAYK